MFKGLFQKKPKPQSKGPAMACLHSGYCSKQLCPMWVILDSTVVVDGAPKVHQEGKCAHAWTPQLMIELRHHIGIGLGNMRKKDENAI